MYKCNNCGELYEDCELKTHEESRGEFWGSPCTETVYDDCACGGEIEEATECKCCNEYFCTEDLHDGVCETCLKENATLQNALKIGIPSAELILLNEFLRYIFTDSEIEEILIEYVKKKVEEKDPVFLEGIENYCLDDKSAFAKWLVKKS